MSSICDERGEELLYAGIPISRVLEEEMGIGGVLSLLWFQKRLPNYVNKFIEICLILTADHGPAVSGAGKPQTAFVSELLFQSIQLSVLVPEKTLSLHWYLVFSPLAIDSEELWTELLNASARRLTRD